jgi:hypothetical protein
MTFKRKLKFNRTKKKIYKGGVATPYKNDKSQEKQFNEFSKQSKIGMHETYDNPIQMAENLTRHLSTTSIGHTRYRNSLAKKINDDFDKLKTSTRKNLENQIDNEEKYKKYWKSFPLELDNEEEGPAPRREKPISQLEETDELSFIFTKKSLINTIIRKRFLVYPCTGYDRNIPLLPFNWEGYVEDDPLLYSKELDDKTNLLIEMFDHWNNPYDDEKFKNDNLFYLKFVKKEDRIVLQKRVDLAQKYNNARALQGYDIPSDTSQVSVDINFSKEFEGREIDCFKEDFKNTNRVKILEFDEEDDDIVFLDSEEDEVDELNKKLEQLKDLSSNHPEILALNDEEKEELKKIQNFDKFMDDNAVEIERPPISRDSVLKDENIKKYLDEDTDNIVFVYPKSLNEDEQQAGKKSRKKSNKKGGKKSRKLTKRR